MYNTVYDSQAYPADFQSQSRPRWDVESSFLKVIKPEGATTGPITVTTTKGTLTSNKVFVVRP